MRSTSPRSLIACVALVLTALTLACTPPPPAPEPAPAELATVRLNGRIPPVGPYSAGVASGDFVFLAGQIALDHEGEGLVEGGITEQTHQVMQNLQAVLEEAGLGFGDVVRTGVFLADVNDFGAMNEVYASYFPEGGIPPARTTVAVAAIPLGALLEIDMIAAR